MLSVFRNELFLTAKGVRMCLRLSTMCRVPRIPQVTEVKVLTGRLVLLVFIDDLLDPK